MSDDPSTYGVNALARPGQLPALARCREAGILWIRVDLNWNNIQPDPGVFCWDLVDSYVRKADELGLSVFATLAYTPAWANGGRERTAPPCDTSQWQAFVRTVVSRYADTVSHWGMWNEPNLPGFYSGTKQEYLDRILIPGMEAAREVDSSCKLLGPDLSHDGKGRWSLWMRDILAAAADRLDAITHHIYKEKFDGYTGLFTFLDGEPCPWNGPSLLNALRKFGVADRDVWITEVGWTSDSMGEQQQAHNYGRLLEGLAKRSWVRKIFFYELMEDPNWEKKFGILRADGSPKPAYDAYRGWIEGTRPD